jgi:hypothetical protein
MNKSSLLEKLNQSETLTPLEIDFLLQTLSPVEGSFLNRLWHQPEITAEQKLTLSDLLLTDTLHLKVLVKPDLQYEVYWIHNHDGFLIDPAIQAEMIKLSEIEPANLASHAPGARVAFTAHKTGLGTYQIQQNDAFGRVLESLQAKKQKLFDKYHMETVAKVAAGVSVAIGVIMACNYFSQLDPTIVHQETATVISQEAEGAIVEIQGDNFCINNTQLPVGKQIPITFKINSSRTAQILNLDNQPVTPGAQPAEAFKDMSKVRLINHTSGMMMVGKVMVPLITSAPESAQDCFARLAQLK